MPQGPTGGRLSVSDPEVRQRVHSRRFTTGVASGYACSYDWKLLGFSVLRGVGYSVPTTHKQTVVISWVRPASGYLRVPA